MSERAVPDAQRRTDSRGPKAEAAGPRREEDSRGPQQGPLENTGPGREGQGG